MSTRAVATGVARNVWIVLVLAFALLPLVIIVINSFSSVSYGAWPPPGWSTRWYGNLVSQDGLADAVILSLVVAIPVTAITLAIGLGASVALSRYRFLGKRWVSAGAFAPIVVPKVALGFALFIYLNRLALFGAGPLGLILGHIVITLPFATTILTAALVRSDLELEAAAVDLGARPVRAFATITLPQIRGALVATALFVFIISFDEVDASVFLVPFNQQTLPTWMFQYMQKYQDPTLAALSTILIAVSLALAGICAIILSRSGVLSALARSNNRR